MIATQYSTASEATGCRHSTRFKSSWDYRVPASGRFAGGTVLGGDTNRMIHAQSPSFYPPAPLFGSVIDWFFPICPNCFRTV